MLEIIYSHNTHEFTDTEKTELQKIIQSFYTVKHNGTALEVGIIDGQGKIDELIKWLTDKSLNPVILGVFSDNSEKHLYEHKRLPYGQYVDVVDHIDEIFLYQDEKGNDIPLPYPADEATILSLMPTVDTYNKEGDLISSVPETDITKLPVYLGWSSRYWA